MKIKLASAAASILLNTFGASAVAAQPAVQTTMVDIAGHQVPVIAGGMYDRFRSNPPLSVVAQESPNTDLSWFKTLKKEKRDIGFESYSPNFYYENSKVTMVYTADLEKLRALIPSKVLNEVQPLQVWPGRGLVALTAYAYHHCDNDSYNEIALSVLTNKPGEGNYGPLSLISQTMDKNLWGYVFKLPVDTELAKVRGVVGYNLPKWKTRIDYRQTDNKIVFEVADANSGKTDFVIEGTKLKDVSKNVALNTQSFTNLGHNGQLQTGYSVARQQVHGSSFSQESVNLKLSEGSFSTFIKSLDLGRMVQYQYVPNFQMALYAPEPLSKASSSK